MIKDPQNIVKFSSQATDGDYLQMVFDSEGMTHWEMSRRLYSFMRGMDYVIDYPPAPEPRSESAPAIFGAPYVDQEQEDKELAHILMVQFDDTARNTSKHPEDVEYDVVLMGALDKVIKHNLAPSEYKEWLQKRTWE
jgi:hypothetical protein